MWKEEEHRWLCASVGGASTLGPREDIDDDENGLFEFVAEKEWEGRLARERREDCRKKGFKGMENMYDESSRL
jgi:hypothetical protein